ncbi:MAG: hypothetical protein R3F31_02110 [Verrucomicrobiales bacterium]
MKSDIQKALEKTFPDRGQQSSVTHMLWNLSRVMAQGDVIFAKLGRSEVIGWGVVSGEFSFDPTLDELQNILPVNWEAKKAIKLSDGKLLPIKALTEITEDHELLEMLGKAYSGVPGLESSEGDTDDPVLIRLKAFLL